MKFVNAFPHILWNEQLKGILKNNEDKKMLQNKRKSGIGSKTVQEQAQNRAEIAGGRDAWVEMELNFEEHLVPIFWLSCRTKSDRIYQQLKHGDDAKVEEEGGILGGRSTEYEKQPAPRCWPKILPEVWVLHFQTSAVGHFEGLLAGGGERCVLSQTSKVLRKCKVLWLLWRQYLASKLQDSTLAFDIFKYVSCIHFMGVDFSFHGGFQSQGALGTPSLVTLWKLKLRTSS